MAIIESFLAVAAAMPMKCRREGLEGGIALMSSLRSRQRNQSVKLRKRAMNYMVNPGISPEDNHAHERVKWRPLSTCNRRDLLLHAALTLSINAFSKKSAKAARQIVSMIET